MKLDPKVVEALAESGLEMHQAADVLAANMTATMSKFGATIGAAMSTVAPKIAEANEQTRRNIVAALERTKTP